MTDYNSLYNDIVGKLNIKGSDGKVYLSLLAHDDLKKIIMGLTKKEISGLIKFLKIYRVSKK